MFVVAIQPGPPEQVLAFGSNAIFECQAQPDLANFRQIKWNITIGSQKYFEIADIPERYGKLYSQ